MGHGLRWVLIQTVLLIALVAAGPIDSGGWHQPAGLALGGVCFVVGGAVGIAGVVRLGRNRTPFPRPRAGSRLVDHGIYRWVRHPLYLSVMLAGLGWALLWQSPSAFLIAAILVPFFDAKARREEVWLREAFPDYEAYARRVKRFLPGLY